MEELTDNKENTMEELTDNKESTMKDLTDKDMENVTGGSGCSMRNFCIDYYMKTHGCDESDQDCRNKAYNNCHLIPCF